MLLSSIRSLNLAILCSRLTFRWWTLTRVWRMRRKTLSPKWWRIRFDTVFSHHSLLIPFFLHSDLRGLCGQQWELIEGCLQRRLGWRPFDSADSKRKEAISSARRCLQLAVYKGGVRHFLLHALYECSTF